MFSLTSKKIWLILTGGIILRLVLAAISFHSDIQAFGFAAWVIDQGKILNLYDYLYSLSAGSPVLKSYPVYFFNYPPAIYFFHGFFALFFNIFLSSNYLESFLFNFPSTLGSFQLNLHLLFLKLPYLIFDLGLAWLLIKMFDSSKEKFLILTLWMFNPINLYATYLMGQFDIIPTFFVVLSLYLVKVKPRISWLSGYSLSAIALGLGSAFKIYPLFLLLPLASFANSWKERIIIILLGPLIYLLTISLFLPSEGFRSTALVANQTLKSLYPQIPVSGGESILLFLAALVFFYLFFLYKKEGVKQLWPRYFIILLLFFIFTHYHPQWFLWLTPFLIFDLVISKFKHWLILATAGFSFAGLLFFFEPSLTIGLFAPLNPTLYQSQSIWQILHLNPDYNLFRSLLQTIFVGSAAFYIYHYVTQNRDA